MPGIVALVAAVSADLVAAMALANYPPLVDGAIVLGRQHVLEQYAPPRVVFIPTKSKFSARSVSTAAPFAGNPTPELLKEWQQRSIRTEEITFEVHVWGVSDTTQGEVNPDADFDATQLLYQAVILSVHKLTVGRYELLDGEWADQRAGATQHMKYGHEFVFGLRFGTPVLDLLLPLAPSGTAANSTTKFQPPDGSPAEVGCTS
jgi:hypothetical protein